MTMTRRHTRENQLKIKLHCNIRRLETYEDTARGVERVLGGVPVLVEYQWGQFLCRVLSISECRLVTIAPSRPYSRTAPTPPVRLSS